MQAFANPEDIKDLKDAKINTADPDVERVRRYRIFILKDWDCLELSHQKIEESHKRVGLQIIGSQKSPGPLLTMNVDSKFLAGHNIPPNRIFIVLSVNKISVFQMPS